MHKNIFRFTIMFIMLAFVGVIVACTDVKVDKTSLKNLVETHELRDEDDYTVSSWDDYIEAFESAKLVLEKEDATQKEVDEAFDLLQSKINALELSDGSVNKDKLAQLITDALTKLEADYTADSWQSFSEALTAAQTINDDADATQAQVNAAYDDLKAAIEALEAVTGSNKDALEAQVELALAEDESLYSEADWEALQTAISNAEAVLENDAATSEDISDALQALKDAMTKGHSVVWQIPEETFVLTHDVIRFRNDRESDINAMLVGLVTATVDNEPVQVIAEGSTLPVRDENGLYPIGEWEITYKTLGKNNVAVTTTYTIDIVDGKTVDVYFYGANSNDYAQPAETGGAQYWLGGEGIRVSQDLFFVLEGELDALPSYLVTVDNGKLIDLLDPMALQNKTDNTITYQVNEITGVHILMTANGRVKMMYEGIQNDLWTTEGKSKMTPSVFGNTNIVLEPGDIHLIIGYSTEGNYYSTFEATENHWRDGRFVARNTIGGADRMTASNVAVVKQGETLITLPYENQAPYITKDAGALVINKDSEVPSKEMLLNGMEFKDDNGIWSKNDIVISLDNIEVSHAIDTSVLGDYEVIITVSDGTLTSEFTRVVTVIEGVTSDFISYTDAEGIDQLYRDASGVTVFNEVAPSAVGFISIYDAAYFNANKADSTKFSPSNFGVYVLVGSNGEFIESYFNSNIINAENPMGAKAEGSVSDATAQALNTLTLEDGQYIMFFQQNSNNEVRTFAQNLRDAFKNRIGEGRIQIIDVSGVNNRSSISYTNADGEVIAYHWVEEVAVFNEVAPSVVGYISIYDATYFNANKADSTKFSPSNFGVYVLVGSNGEFIESYFNTNIINAENPMGAKAEGSVSDATAQALNTLTLEDGQYIMFFQQNSNNEVRTFAQNLRDAFKNRIGQPSIIINAFGQNNA